jgi:hypothetical protein
MELRKTWPLLIGYWTLYVPQADNFVHFHGHFLVTMEQVVVNHQRLDEQCYQKSSAICQLICQEPNLQHIHPEHILFKRG